MKNYLEKKTFFWIMGILVTLFSGIVSSTFLINYYKSESLQEQLIIYRSEDFSRNLKMQDSVNEVSMDIIELKGDMKEVATDVSWLKDLFEKNITNIEYDN